MTPKERARIIAETVILECRHQKKDWKEYVEMVVLKDIEAAEWAMKERCLDICRQKQDYWRSLDYAGRLDGEILGAGEVAAAIRALD